MTHVLIIEDELLLAEILRYALEDEGVTSFDFATTEEAAVAAAIAHIPDLITSDVRLDAGTGPNAVATIFQRLGEIPVIFVTGTPAECVPCNPPGRVLTKPLDFQEFVQAVHESLPL